MIGFRSAITKKILEYFLVNFQKRAHINGLSRILEVDVGNLARKLNELEKEGILLSASSGNQRLYGLNLKYPLLKETKKIFETEFGLEKELQNVLKKIKGLKNAYIFGSWANHKFKKDSDIDLLLVGEHSSREAQRAILVIGKKLGREINIVDISAGELERKRKKKDDFFQNIFSHKIIKII